MTDTTTESVWIVGGDDLDMHKTVLFESEDDAKEYIESYEYNLSAYEVEFVPEGGSPSFDEFEGVHRNYEPMSWYDWQEKAQSER